MKTRRVAALFMVSAFLALAFAPLSSGTGSITFTSPAPGAVLSGADQYNISGIITPTPSGSDIAAIRVTNPSGTLVDITNELVQSGTFTYSTAVGGTAAWVNGVYNITVKDSYGAVGSTTFTYSKTPPVTTTSTTSAPTTSTTASPTSASSSTSTTSAQTATSTSSTTTSSTTSPSTTSTTSTTSVSSSAPASSATSSTSSGGVPEFPAQAMLVGLLTAVVVGSYLLVRRRPSVVGF